MKIRALQDLRYRSEGQDYAIPEGEETEIPDEVAAWLSRDTDGCGFMEVGHKGARATKKAGKEQPPAEEKAGSEEEEEETEQEETPATAEAAAAADD